jgi:DNA-binding NtrC family response regulator
MNLTDGHDSEKQPLRKVRRRLLIVEPDRLTRWSIEQYLRSGFDVESADSAAAAQGPLDSGRFDAIVIADDLPDGGADNVEQRARSRNPDVATVRTTTHVSEAAPTTGRTVLLEKPFELTSLGRVLEME